MEPAGQVLQGQALRRHRDRAHGPRRGAGTRPEPFNSTPTGVNSIPSGSPHVRPMGVHRTCGEPDEIKKSTHPKYFTALFRAGVQSLLTVSGLGGMRPNIILLGMFREREHATRAAEDQLVNFRQELTAQKRKMGTPQRAVQLHPHGGQSDFVWLSARTMRPHVGLNTCGGPNEIKKKNTHPKWFPFPFCRAGERALDLRAYDAMMHTFPDLPACEAKVSGGGGNPTPWQPKSVGSRTRWQQHPLATAPVVNGRMGERAWLWCTVPCRAAPCRAALPRCWAAAGRPPFLIVIVSSSAAPRVPRPHTRHGCVLQTRACRCRRPLGVGVTVAVSPCQSPSCSFVDLLPCDSNDYDPTYDSCCWALLPCDSRDYGSAKQRQRYLATHAVTSVCMSPCRWATRRR